jgi:hypothetical protein
MVWAGGRFGRVAQQAYYWSFRMQEKLDGWRARQREAKRRTAEPKPLEAARVATPVAAMAADLPAVEIVSVDPTVAELQAAAPKKKRRTRRKKRDVVESAEVPAPLNGPRDAP